MPRKQVAGPDIHLPADGNSLPPTCAAEIKSNLTDLHPPKVLSLKSNLLGPGWGGKVLGQAGLMASVAGNLTDIRKAHQAEDLGSEGFDSQSAYFLRIGGRPEMHDICLIGFGAGHEAAVWLSAGTQSRVHAFDPCSKDNAYIRPAATYLNDKFGSRFTLTCGGIMDTAPHCNVVSVDWAHNRLQSLERNKDDKLSTAVPALAPHPPTCLAACLALAFDALTALAPTVPLPPPPLQEDLLVSLLRLAPVASGGSGKSIVIMDDVNCKSRFSTGNNRRGFSVGRFIVGTGGGFLADDMLDAFRKDFN
eukprot:gene4908-5051_t